MKLSEAIANINKADIADVYEVANFAEYLNINYYGCDEVIPKRLKEVFLTKWICTDTWVGTRVYFLDDVPVAISYLNARKSTEQIDFLSQNDVQRMRSFILSLMDDDSEDSVRVCNIDKEIEDYYTVSYSSQLLVDEGYYNGEIVKVVKKYRDYRDIANWEYVDVLSNDGIIKIKMSEFHIPINVVKEK